MKDHAGKSRSVWMATVNLPPGVALMSDAAADVVVVGAGITGLTTAYLLGQAGKSVIVLDDGPMASGETERTTAHLSIALDYRYFELEGLHGADGARRAAESHSAAIAEIARIVQAEKIDCEFERVDGYLFPAEGELPDMLDRELAAVHRAGVTDAVMVSLAGLGTLEAGPALRFPRQAQFHPLRYLAALAKAIVRDGGRIYSQTHVTEINGGEPARIKVQAGHVVTAGAVVVATNSPINELLAIHTKQAAYRTYVIGAVVPRGVVARALFWDSGDPYHYVRLQPGRPGEAVETPSDLLLVGGEDHKTGQDDDAEARYLRLERWARERFPIGTVKFRWSGQVMDSLDGLAFIGHHAAAPKNIYVATGDSGSGLTHGTIAGLLLTDLISKRENPWTKLYDPSRVTPGTVVEFVEATVNTAWQYGDWLRPGEGKSENQVFNDSGAILGHGADKVAAYRDEQGHLHQCSAICPHLGGIVRWNHAEKTWDCPCHGSRFDRFGKVVNGPANGDLKPVAPPVVAGT